MGTRSGRAFPATRAEYQSVVTCFYSGETPLQEVDASGYRRQVYSLDRRSDADISQPPQQWDGRIEGVSAAGSVLVTTLSRITASW